MLIDTLEDLYIEQLHDVYSASGQMLAVAKDLFEVATDQSLSGALAQGVDGIQSGVNTLEVIAKRHDENLEGAHCEAMRGMVDVSKAHVLAGEFGESYTRDAIIIVHYQRLMHYMIAGYGCLAAFADRLELDHDVVELNSCLSASYRGDRTMTDLATGRINKDALG